MILQLISMRFKCYFTLLFLISFLTAHQETGLPHQNHPSQEIMDQALLENKQDFERDFHQWVLDQILQIQQNSMFESTQSFLLQLKSQEQHEFRWAAKSMHKDSKLKIRAFTQQSGDDIAIIKNPDKDSRIEMSFRNSLSEKSRPLVNVYLQKIVSLIVEGEDTFINLRNTHSIAVIVEVSLEGQPQSIDTQIVAKNDHLKIPTIKIQAILAQMRVTESNRKWHYKWQWGFIEREQHYQQEMLKLITGEAIIILVTAIAQMYCIKALFDNPRVV